MKDGEIRTLQVDGHVGFDSLPDQLVATNAVQKGYVFNILCVGETGIGKSTLVDSLFNVNSEDGDSSSSAQPPIPALSGAGGGQLLERKHTLQEQGVQLNLTIVESIGFGDQLNKEESYKTIENYVDEQFETYFREELKIERCLSLYHDTRIHACLYFICPTGNGLKAIDLLCLKKLHEKVNIIPVIGKADALSKTELKKFKADIMSELRINGVKIYDFPVDDEDDTPTASKNMNFDLPFAVVGSREFVRVGSKYIRGRSYPWGNVLVENEHHCDFVKLREMLIRTNMEDLKEQTHQCHYEKYRTERLLQMGFHDDGSSFQEMCHQKLHLQFEELAQIEEDMKHCFILRIKEKEEELKQSERLLREKYDQIKLEQVEENEKLEKLNMQLENEMAEFRNLTEQHLFQKQQPPKKLTGTSSAFSLGSIGRTKKTT